MDNEARIDKLLAELENPKLTQAEIDKVKTKLEILRAQQ